MSRWPRGRQTVYTDYMTTKIDIDTRTFVRFWLVVIGFGFAILALYTASTALLIIGISFFLALALNGPVNRIARRLPGKSRVGATALAYVAVLAILGAIVTLVIPPIVQQTAQVAQTAPSLFENATNQWSGLQDLIDQYNLQPQVDQALSSIQSSASSWAGNVGQSVISGVGSFFAFITGLILVLVLTFLMLVEGPEWMKRIWRFYKDKDRMEQHKRVAHRMYGVVSGFVTGQITVSTIGATAAGLFVFILSLFFGEVSGSLAFPTAAVTFVLSMIPMFGATIGGIIVGILLAFNSIPAAVIYLIYFVIYQQVENNFISPQIQAKRIELSALIILVAVTVGIYMFGIIGGIIAIPIAGSIRVLMDEYLDKNDARRNPSRANTAKKSA